MESAKSISLQIKINFVAKNVLLTTSVYFSILRGSYTGLRSIFQAMMRNWLKWSEISVFEACQNTVLICFSIYFRYSYFIVKTTRWHVKINLYPVRKQYIVFLSTWNHRTKNRSSNLLSNNQNDHFHVHFLYIRVIINVRHFCFCYNYKHSFSIRSTYEGILQFSL